MIDDEGVVVMYDMIHYNTIMCVSKLIGSHFKLCYRIVNEKILKSTLPRTKIACDCR